MARRARIGLLTLALWLAVAGLVACGGDGDDGTATATVAASASGTVEAPSVSEVDGSSPTSTTSTTSTASTATTATTAPDASTQATDATQAAEPATTITGGDLGENPLRLTAGDLPGYEEVPYESEATECLGPALDADAAIAVAPNAFRPADEASEARSRTWSYADEAAATAAFATATGPEVIACIADGAEARLQGEDYEPGGAVTRGELALPTLEGADQQGGTQFVVTFTPKGGTEEVTGYSDLVVVRQGATVAAYQFLANGAPFPPEQEQAAVAAALGRAAGGGGR